MAVLNISAFQELAGDFENRLAGSGRSSGEEGIGGECQLVLDGQGSFTQYLTAVVDIRRVNEFDKEFLSVDHRYNSGDIRQYATCKFDIG